MTLNEAKQRLVTIVDRLPPQKVELLLEIAEAFKQQFQTTPPHPAAPTNEFDIWEQELIAAEEYWFGLPETIRQGYVGKSVAVLKDRILDADDSLPALRRRVAAQFPDQTVLYVEADAEQLAPLYIHTPRFK